MQGHSVHYWAHSQFLLYIGVKAETCEHRQCYITGNKLNGAKTLLSETIHRLQNKQDRNNSILLQHLG